METFFSARHRRDLPAADEYAPMTNLPIHITTHHLSLSDALRRFARKKISSVCRFANDALAAEIVLRRHAGAKERFSASARLALPGRDIHGRGVDTNLYVAIGKLVTKLARLSRKRKTRLAKRFEHPGRNEESPRAAASAIIHQQISSESLPHKQHPRRVEGGQAMRVFPFRREPFPLHLGTVR
jgi:putative sigma-54 modulation protein